MTSYAAKQRYKTELHDVIDVEVLFLHSPQVFLFKSLIQTEHSPLSVPIALHHTIGARFFFALGMFESSEAGPQSYVKQNLMALLISSKKVKYHI